MEWVETTAKTIEDAKNLALDQLGVAADEAEFELVEEPRPGLFGRVRGTARVRARVKPATVRPKQDRRRKGRADSRKKNRQAADTTSGSDDAAPATSSRGSGRSSGSGRERGRASATSTEDARRAGRSDTSSPSTTSTAPSQEKQMSDDFTSTVTPQEVGDAAVAFMDGLVQAIGADGSTSLEVDGTELDVAVTGSDLGLLVGPGGRTLNAIQDLARVAAQRRLGDHETRLRIDVAGYRRRRAEALTRFAADVASQVRDSGVARSLEPMSSADRKVIHDALNDEDGVTSRSEGDDPNRRVVVSPG